MVLRFAPSPTGLLHVGNLRTAIINWIYAKKINSDFLLRIDDTDTSRSKIEYVNMIKEDLKWIGLDWDLTYAQSERIESYNEAFNYLKNEKLIYKCYETDEELSIKRSRQRSAGLPPVYDRSSLKISADKQEQYESEGRKPYWRLKLPDDPIIWNDKIYGEIKFDTKSHSDPVIVRADGRYLYTITSVVDDIYSKVSNIIRGSDHITNSGVQIYLFQILEAKSPNFFHHSLMTDVNGGPLSKRIGSLSIKGIRDRGIEPEVLLNYLTFVGSITEQNEFYKINDLKQNYDINSLGKSNAPFDEKLLNDLNSNFLQKQTYEFFNKKSIEFNFNTASSDFWEAVKNNIKVFKEAQEWFEIIYGKIEPIIEDKEYINLALNLIPNEEFDNSSWKIWTDLIKIKTGKKGKNLFMPLRLSITGKNFGPEMAKLLPLIGKDKIISRLSGNVS
ncbi:MAG: glutamate--tRNA ligase [Rhodospirillaceae bacterium]|nr:glutamate--tRNA ligase [Rhodospirillaceae bacterium]|tara:strand:+ start:13142 stop:14476 length:1335 start_codon:yes stop_codon:yes gene_type:complete